MISLHGPTPLRIFWHKADSIEQFILQKRPTWNNTRCKYSKLSLGNYQPLWTNTVIYIDTRLILLNSFLLIFLKIACYYCCSFSWCGQRWKPLTGLVGLQMFSHGECLPLLLLCILAVVDKGESQRQSDLVCRYSVMQNVDLRKEGRLEEGRLIWGKIRHSEEEHTMMDDSYIACERCEWINKYWGYRTIQLSIGTYGW